MILRGAEVNRMWEYCEVPFPYLPSVGCPPSVCPERKKQDNYLIDEYGCGYGAGFAYGTSSTQGGEAIGDREGEHLDWPFYDSEGVFQWGL